MKSLFIAFTLLFSYFSDREVIGYRELLHKSFYNEDLAKQYYERTKHITASSLPLLRGYKAMSEFVMIRHTFNPFSKLMHFNRGRKELDAAISAEPDNVELIFLRFATQVNAPSFLGYNTCIVKDKNALVAYATGTDFDDRDLRTKVSTFLLKSKHTSATEKALIKTTVNQ